MTMEEARKVKEAGMEVRIWLPLPRKDVPGPNYQVMTECITQAAQREGIKVTHVVDPHDTRYEPEDGVHISKTDGPKALSRLIAEF